MKEIVALYRSVTYRPKHSHHIDWDSTMSDIARLRAACIAGLMLGAALFCAFLM